MRTECKFDYIKNDFWEIVDKWKSNTNWTLYDKNEDFQHFQKTSLISGPKMNILIQKNGHSVLIQAWLDVRGINKLLTLGMTPSEVSIDTQSKSVVDNVIGVVPQAVNRAALNNLLTSLNQNTIS